ncbi:sulfotransferase [Thermodesulfobacteriota bacterium]
MAAPFQGAKAKPRPLGVDVYLRPYRKKMLDTAPRICVVAGMPRAGTTFLYHNLGRHPELFAPFRKETNYFLTNMGRGLDWYLGLYKEMLPHQIALDVSPSYFIDLATIERIKAYRGDTPVIMAVRDPAELAVSWYEQQLTHFYRFVSFEDFLRSWTARRGDGDVTIRLGEGHIRRALEAFCKGFGDNVLLYDYAAFKAAPLAILRSIERFLGLQPYFTEENFDNSVINAVNRKNFIPLAYLLSRETTIKFIEKGVPRRLTLLLRKLFDAMSTPSEPKHTTVHDPRRIELAADILKDDVRFVENMFKDKPVQLGSGRPL